MEIASRCDKLPNCQIKLALIGVPVIRKLQTDAVEDTKYIHARIEMARWRVFDVHQITLESDGVLISFQKF